MPMPGVVPEPMPDLSDAAAPPPQPPLPVAAPLGGPVPLATASGLPACVPIVPSSTFSLPLTKTSVLGFGLTLDSENVVTLVKPGSQAASSGAIAIGDRVLTVDAKAVTPDVPAKSLAASPAAASGGRGRPAGPPSGGAQTGLSAAHSS